MSSSGKGKGKSSSVTSGQDKMSADDADADDEAEATRRTVRKKRKTNKYMKQLTPGNWDILDLIAGLLTPFHIAQTALEAEKHISSSFVPFQIAVITTHLEEAAGNFEQDTAMQEAAKLLLDDFKPRWTEWSRSIRFAVVLNPLTKFAACFSSEVRKSTWAELEAEVLAVYKVQRDANKSEKAPPAPDGGKQSANGTFSQASCQPYRTSERRLIVVCPLRLPPSCRKHSISMRRCKEQHYQYQPQQFVWRGFRSNFRS